MVTYVVASKAHQPYLSECQILGEFLNKNAPDVSVQFVIKDSSEWKEFLNSVCRSYGFEKKSCPIIYTLEGALIGSGSDFVEHVRERYDKQVPVSKEQQKGRTKLNVLENEERMRKKDVGDTLGEQIMKNLVEVHDEKTACLIDDAFYQEQLEAGQPFQLRRTNMLKDKPMKGLKFGRYYDIPDEFALRQAQIAVVEEKEAQRDRTYDEFLEMFKDHIEGKCDAQERVGNRPGTAEAADAGPEKAAERNTESVEGSRKYQSIASHGRASAASDSKHSSVRQTATGNQSQAKYDLPKSCKLTLPAKQKVRDLDDGFMLLAHPYPQIEGEMLLLQPHPEDNIEIVKIEEQKQEDGKDKSKKKRDKDGPDLVYRDYSLRKRHFTLAKPKAGSKNALAKKQELELDQTKTKIQCLEVDLEAPVSSIDWNYIALTITEIDALVWFQVLPANQKSSHPFQFNCFHVLPNANIPFPVLPIEKMIKNKMTFNTKADKQQRGAAGGSKGQMQKHDAIHSRDSEAAEAGIVLLDEYQFPHAVYPINPSEMSIEGLKFAYSTIANFLGLKTKQDAGMTVIVAPQFMFVALMSQPYHMETRTVTVDFEYGDEQQEAQADVAVYLDGFAYCGIVNLQNLSQGWPATAGQGYKEYAVMEAITEQSRALPE